MTAEILKSTRKLLALTMREMAGVAGVTGGAVSGWENGDHTITAQNRRTLKPKLRALCLKRAGQLQKRAEELR